MSDIIRIAMRKLKPDSGTAGPPYDRTSGIMSCDRIANLSVNYWSKNLAEVGLRCSEEVSSVSYHVIYQQVLGANCTWSFEHDLYRLEP